MSGPLLKDANWVRQAFLVTTKDMEKLSVQNRTTTSASFKFTDTTPGGNFAINPPPQFTRFADPKATIPVSDMNPIEKMSPYAGSRGMGRYYSEAIDDNQQLIHMRFGVPQFNSLTTFFTGFYDTSAGQIARTGRADSIFYTLGRAIGFVISVIYWPLLVANMLGSGLRYFLQKPSSKFYFLKPTMPVYWNAVQTIVNQIAVQRGIVPRIGGDGNADHRFGAPYNFDDDALIAIHKKMPDIFLEKGGIDVFAMANRAQRLASKKHDIQKAYLDVDNIANMSKIIQATETAALTDDRPTFASYMTRWWGSSASKPKDAQGNDVTTESVNVTAEANTGFFDFLTAELNDGGAFATFAVNSTGSVSESFSSQVGQSDIASKINSMSSSSRSSNFNFANGNLVGGAAGAVMGAAMLAVKATVAGVAEGLHISGIAALGGAAFVDIPQHWQSSTAQLTRSNYTVNLRSWSGNPISQLLNLHVPLAMLLAGALPMATGKQSFTSPFILELYDQGRCQVRLGMIDSMTVTRGVGNLGYDREGNAMGIDVTFSVIDLSSIMSMPISEGFSWDGAMAGAQLGAVVGGVTGAVSGGVVGAVVGTTVGATAGGTVGAGVDAISALGVAVKGAFSEDTVFSDYMATLAATSLPDQIYQWRKFKLNATRQMVNFKTFFSAAHFASFVGDIPPMRLVSAIYKGTAR